LVQKPLGPPWQSYKNNWYCDKIMGLTSNHSYKSWAHLPGLLQKQWGSPAGIVANIIEITEEERHRIELANT
jgi:hypothetical protein